MPRTSRYSLRLSPVSRTMGPQPAMKRTFTFAAPCMASPLAEMRAGTCGVVPDTAIGLRGCEPCCTQLKPYLISASNHHLDAPNEWQSSPAGAEPGEL